MDYDSTPNNGRRDFLRKSSFLTLAGIGMVTFGSALNSTLAFAEGDGPNPPSDGKIFELPPLPYSYDALEPYIDKLTMEIHHDKHHAAYVNNLNKALSGSKEKPDIINICKNISKYSTEVRNNAGGHYNHSFFWKIMAKPNQPFHKEGKLDEAIKTTFGSMDNFKSRFNDAGLGRFGSGWIWLVVNEGKLEILSTPNQDNPLMDIADFKGTPVLALDVWEHAYYLKYKNERAEYEKAWWNVVNWEQAEKNFLAAK